MQNVLAVIPAVVKIQSDLLDEEVTHILDTEDPDALIHGGGLLDLLKELNLVFLALLGNLCQVD